MYYGIEIFDNNSLSVNKFTESYVEMEEEDAIFNHTLIKTISGVLTIIKDKHICVYFKSEKERNIAVEILLDSGDYLNSYIHHCNTHTLEEARKKYKPLPLETVVDYGYGPQREIAY